MRNLSSNILEIGDKKTEFYSLEHDEKNFNRKAIIFIHGANHEA